MTWNGTKMGNPLPSNRQHQRNTTGSKQRSTKARRLAEYRALASRKMTGEIIKTFINSTQANITIQKLLEIAPYCKKKC